MRAGTGIPALGAPTAQPKRQSASLPLLPQAQHEAGTRRAQITCTVLMSSGRASGSSKGTDRPQGSYEKINLETPEPPRGPHLELSASELGCLCSSSALSGKKWLTHKHSGRTRHPVLGAFDKPSTCSPITALTNAWVGLISPHSIFHRGCPPPGAASKPPFLLGLKRRPASDAGKSPG